MNQLIDDGSLDVARGRNMARLNYPFGNFPTPDTFSRLIVRGMVQRPRFFEPATMRRKLWLNRVLASSSLNDGAFWVATRCTPETDGTLTPDKLLAWKLREDASNDTHFLEQTGVAIVAGNVVRYLIAKAGERSRIQLAALGDVEVARGFDLLTGETFTNTLSMLEPERVEMFHLENGWWFCGFLQTFTSGLAVQTLLDDGSGTFYAGDDTSGVYVAFDHVMNSDFFGPILQTYGEARSISAPLSDPGDELRTYDPWAYLLEESEPQPDSVGRFIWDRVFGRIPVQQVMPVTMVISKPGLPGTFPQDFGSYEIRYRVFQPDPTILILDAYVRQEVTGDSGIPAFYPAGGTYTLTFDGDTTSALAWDASAGTVQTALNALASVTSRGGCTVTGTHNSPTGFTVVFNSYASATGDASGLTGSGAGVTITFGFVISTNGGYSQLLQFSPSQDSSAATGNSSFGPAPANPMTIGINAVNTIDVYLGNYANSAPATSGTFTLTLWGDTTAALNWNDSMATIAAAVNGLAAVAARGSYTFSSIGPIHGVTVYRGTFTPVAITGGDYTLTLFGQTTGPIAYDATLADITTELNLLSEVTDRGGVIATHWSPIGLPPVPAGESYNGRQIFFGLQFSNELLTGNAASLTPAGATISPVTNDTGQNRSQRISFSAPASRVLTIPNHGLTAGDKLYMIAGGIDYFIREGTVTIIDGDNISLAITPDLTYAGAGTVTQAGKRTKANYKPGSASVPATKVTDYFLPGVSFGIATIGDIPIPTSQSDTDSFLLATFSGSQEINWQVGELVQWKGPIVSISRTIIRASDV